MIILTYNLKNYSNNVYNEMHTYRCISDKLIWTHIFPLYTIWRCYKNKKIELGSMMTIITILSTMYHYKKESDPWLNFIENNFAKILTTYFVLHAYKCKHKKMQKIEISLMFVGYIIYYMAGYGIVDYEKWHALNHIWPITYILIYAEKHDNIFM